MMSYRLSFAGVILALILMFLYCCSLSAQEQRTWSDATGKFKIEAKLQRIENDKVFLEKQDGKITSIPLAKLSKEDQEYVASQKENPFADEGEANPFTSEDSSKSPANSGSTAAKQTPKAESPAVSGLNFDIEPKRLNGFGTVSFTGANNTSWNCPPDADTTPSFKDRPAAVPFGIGELPFGVKTEYQVRPYFAGEKHHILAAIQIEMSRNSGISNRSSRSSSSKSRRIGTSETNGGAVNDNETRFMFCNLETGDITSKSIPDKITLLDISPDGTTALFRSGIWSSPDSGTKNVLYIADINSQNIKVLSAYAPFDDERSDFMRDIKNAFMLTNDAAAVMSNNGLTVFNTKTGRVIWKTDNTGGTPAFSANKKYCIVNGSMLEAATGKSIGKFDTENSGVQNNVNRTSSFSPDGKYVAFTNWDTITFFDAETGKAAEPFYIGSGGGKHVWTSNQFVLAGRQLVDSKTKSLVWEYNPAEFYFGGYTWYMCSVRGQEKVLIPAKLPHPAAAVTALKPEWAVAPGKEVALKIDGSISDRKSEIAAYLEKILKENGVRIKDNAPITVEASIRKEKESSVYYVTGGRFGMPPPMFMRPNEGGTEIKYIPEVYSITVKKGDKTYWGTSTTKAPPQNVSLEEIKKSSLQDVVNREMAKIKYADWFLKVKIPKQIPGGNIGNSMVTANGITEFKK